MKFKFFTPLLLSLLFLSSVYAQEYKTWHLPEGATMRLGKGEIEDFAFSRDGNELAVSSSTGIWIYSVATGDELALLTGHTARVGTLVFSPDGEILHHDPMSVTQPFLPSNFRNNIPLTADG